MCDDPTFVFHDIVNLGTFSTIKLCLKVRAVSTSILRVIEFCFMPLCSVFHFIAACQLDMEGKSKVLGDL